MARSKLYTSGARAEHVCRVCGETLALRHADERINQGRWECPRCGRHTRLGPLTTERVNPMLGAGQRVVRWF